MKKLIVFFLLLAPIFFCGCSGNQQKGSIQFIPLSENDFNYPADTSFAIPKGKIWEERKKLHDSCMGSSYAANAIFIRTKDTFSIGCIVNRKTMRVVKTLSLRDFFRGPVVSAVSFITKPCYEKRQIDVSVDSFLNKRLSVKIDKAPENINRELMNEIDNSTYTEVETGSWVNLEINDAFGKILDTTNDPEKLEYKKYLLEPDNMILVRSSSLTDVTFYIHTKKTMSSQLQAILQQKPFVTIENTDIKSQLFLINNTSFQLVFRGIFQVMGQFMRCELK